VHVWGGISWKGKTSLVIFEGIMDTRGFIQVLESGLVPFVEKNPLTLLMQDNDPKHASRVAREWMDVNGITWWKTPPESPDINPIENMHHSLY
jgi:hypothetical protein